MFYAESFTLKGSSAWLGVLAFLLFIYVFIYLPIKIFVKLTAHIKAKADRIQKLQSNVVIAEYDPPENLSPAEIGYLFDSKLNINEIFATIIDLEQKGILKIDDSQNRYIVQEINENHPQLHGFDAFILNRLRESKGKKINERYLKSLRLKSSLEMDSQLRAKGYLKSMHERVKGIGIRLSVMTGVLLILSLFSLHPHSLEDLLGFVIFTIFFGPFLLFAAVFLLIAYNKIAGEPWLGAEKLKEVWPDIEGYRQYIKMVEEDNLKFESENTKGIIKHKALPYAIALGFDTGWKNKV